MATNDDRKRYLSGVSRARGAEAAARLRRDAWELMREAEASQA